MAAYHLGCLREAVAHFHAPAEVPIPLQAHFEGVLYCADAASDQLLEYLVQRCRLETTPLLQGNNRTLTNVLSYLGGAAAGRTPINSSTVASLEAWNAQPIAGDARRVRNLAAHEYHVESSGPDVVDRVRLGRAPDCPRGISASAAPPSALMKRAFIGARTYHTPSG